MSSKFLIYSLYREINNTLIKQACGDVSKQTYLALTSNLEELSGRLMASQRAEKLFKAKKVLAMTQL